MEWLSGLALLPALACAVMMGGMALGAVLGLRRTQGHTSTPPTPPTDPTPPTPPAPSAAETDRRSDELESAAR